MLMLAWTITDILHQVSAKIGIVILVCHVNAQYAAWGYFLKICPGASLRQASGWKLLIVLGIGRNKTGHERFVWIWCRRGYSC